MPSVGWVLRLRRPGGTELIAGGSENTNAGGELRPPRRFLRLPVRRYGTETLVLSPLFVMLKVPADATGE